MKKLADWIVDKKGLIFLFVAVLTVAAVLGIFKTNINYDMSKYLPSDSSVKQGMELMAEEYGDMSAITVMFDDLSEKEQTERKTELESLEHVKNVIYLQDDEAYQKKNHSKYMINVSANTYSEEARKVLQSIKDTYGDSAYLCGAVVDNDMMVNTLLEEIPVIAVIAVVIIFAILFLLCNSWVEPFLYMCCIGIAIILNMGSNVFLPSVSFMTFAVGALLQMGLSMDYSIMLMNRYNQEKKKQADSVPSMKKALTNAFSAITSSSVTTIVGLLVLLFMSFKIGQDMGIVLAKGVFISLLCIFTVLPGLVVVFDKAMAKTHKKSLEFNMKPLMRFAGKIRFVSVPLIILVTIAAVFLKNGMEIIYVKTFDNPDQTKIEEAFGMDNQTVLLYDRKENPEHIAEYIDWLEGREDVNSVQDYSNTIGKSYTYQELTEDMDISLEQAKMLYQMYKDNQNSSDYKKITMYHLICYMDRNVAGNPAYAEFMDKDQIEQIHDARKELEDGKDKMKDGRKELTDAGKDLEDGEEELSDGEKKIADGKKEIAKNEKKLKDSERTITKNEKKLADSEKLIRKNQKKLTKSEKKLAAGEKQIAKAEKEMAANEKKLVEGEKKLREAEEQMQLAGMTEEMIAAQLGSQKAELQTARQQLEAGKKQLQKEKAKLVKARKQLEGGKKKLAKGRKQLEAGKKKLAKGRKQLENGKKELGKAKKQLEDAEEEIKDGKEELKDGRKKYNDGKKELDDSLKIYETPMTAKELADEMDENVEDVRDMLKIRRMSMLDVEQDTMTLEEFLTFITDEILPNKTYSAAIDEDMRSEIENGETQIRENRELMLGKKYNRMIISTKYPSEGNSTFACMGELQKKAKGFDKRAYFVGDSAMGYEMDEGFTDELNFVTLLTIIAILLVVLVTFRSFVSSAALVAIIQAAVFITTAIVTLQGYSTNYVALILVQCILMGATIDYGILLFDNYREMRLKLDKEKALGEAMNRSIKTVLTSSLILISTCLTVSVIMTQEIIAQTCLMIAYGAICSVLMVMFILPAVLLLLDHVIIRKKKGEQP